MFFKFGYYDAPDGQQLFPKLAYTTAFAGLAGLTISSYDVALYSHPKGLGAVLGRYIYFTGPMIGMAAAFTTTTYCATNVRGKDDVYNYFMGESPPDPSMELGKKSVTRGLVVGLALGAFAMVKKSSKIEGWEFFPKIQRSTFSTPLRRVDFSLTKERPKNWTTDPNDV